MNAKDDFKGKAQQIFSKISSVLGFQKNWLDVKGEILWTQNEQYVIK